METIKLIAFDLDGTLTQHKTPLEAKNRFVLEQLAEKYRLIMVGAGRCERIFSQLNFPIDIIGNYGMQFSKYNKDTGTLEKIFDIQVPCDRDSIENRITLLRQKFGYTKFSGNNAEFHSSGCITFPLLGTDACQAEKIAFDPDRKKRRLIYNQVKDAFPEFNVFVGGSSSFDMAPKPYDKYYALDQYCQIQGLLHAETVFVGDDYGEGGNDESVFQSDFHFIKIDFYKEFGEAIKGFHLI